MHDLKEHTASTISNPEFIQALTHLFYAVAMADKRLNPKENKAIIEIIQESWIRGDNEENKEGITQLYLKDLLRLKNEELPSEEAFMVFAEYLDEVDEELDAMVKEKIIASCNTIACSYAGLNKNELIILLKLELLLKDKYSKKSAMNKVDKTILKQRLIEQLKSNISSLEGEIKVYSESADLDEEDTMDPEDYSHQTESGGLKMRLQTQLNKMEKDLDLVENLTTEKLDAIEPGAVIELDDLVLYLSVAANAIEINGVKITSISWQAPIFEELSSKKVGDSIKIGDTTQVIRAIH